MTRNSEAPSLRGCIKKSLEMGEMVSSFEKALLTHDKTHVNHKEENDFWDYKQSINLNNPEHVAKLAKWILGFHNASGGVIIIGVDDVFRVHGIPQGQILDNVKLRQKLQKYIGNNIPFFQNQLSTPTHHHVIWLIFIPKRQYSPQPCLQNFLDSESKPILQKDHYYIREKDEVKKCASPNDFERLFSGISFNHLQAYLYDVDELYFRLLAPHQEEFIGRRDLLQKVKEALESRHFIISLDGVGGVGKSALAIELVRQLYNAEKYDFIISLTAKNRVWHQYTEARQANFAGFTQLIQEIAKVLGIDWKEKNIGKLKEEIKIYMQEFKGLLLIDNIEEIDDSNIFTFLTDEIPAPTKVLVTSRIARDLGAKTITVDEMTDDEAKTLLYKELERVHYSKYIDEKEEIETIIQITGKLPLAIKWVTSLTTKHNNLREVINILRNNNNMNEFLEFCFSTMYENLSDLAKNVALVWPYLGDNWNPYTVSLALDKPTYEIRTAIIELEDKGIIQSSHTKDVFLAIPLTIDFLTQKWRKKRDFRNQIIDRFANIFTLEPGGLFNLPKSMQINTLYQKAQQSEAEGNLEEAMKYIDVAFSLDNQNYEVMFAKGKIAYNLRNKNEGIAYMSKAIEIINGVKNHSDYANEYVFLAKILLENQLLTNQVIDPISIAIEYFDKSPFSDKYLFQVLCSILIDNSNYESLSRFAEKINRREQAYWFISEIYDYLNDKQFSFTIGINHLKKLLRLAREFSECTKEEQERFTDALKNLPDSDG